MLLRNWLFDQKMAIIYRFTVSEGVRSKHLAILLTASQSPCAAMVIFLLQYLPHFMAEELQITLSLTQCVSAIKLCTHSSISTGSILAPYWLSDDCPSNSEEFPSYIERVNSQPLE